MLQWTQLMLQTLDSFKDQQDLGKRSDTRWKSKAWSICLEDLQSVYIKTKSYFLEKLKGKLDYTSIYYYIFW